MKKYDIQTLLLYLSQSLSQELMQEISEYFMRNPDELQHVMNIMKINAQNEGNTNQISFERISDKIQYHYSGVVQFLQEQQLAFRSSMKSYQYNFIDFTLNFLWTQDYKCTLQISSNKKSLYYELLSKDFSFIFQNTLTQPEMIELAVPNIYYFYVPSYIKDPLVTLSL